MFLKADLHSRGGRGRQRARSSYNCFHAQIFTMAGAGSRQSPKSPRRPRVAGAEEGSDCGCDVCLALAPGIPCSQRQPCHRILNLSRPQGCCGGSAVYGHGGIQSHTREDNEPPVFFPFWSKPICDLLNPSQDRCTGSLRAWLKIK